jgi:signal transduction histidine kinase/ActR/RegA family two-component response regulator
MILSSENIIIQSKEAKLKALYNKAFSYKTNKEYIKAVEVYHKIIKQKQDNPECIECAKLYEDVGDIYFEVKDFQRAFDFMQKALQIYADNNEYELQLNQYKKIGGLQQGVWQFKKAIEIFQQGLMLSQRLEKKDKIIEFELLLGNVLNWADRLEEAEQYLVSAIEKEKRLNLPLIKLRAHVSYAILLRKMRKFDKAEKLFKLGMKLSAENNNAYLMDITKSYGIMHCEMGNYETAEKLLLDAEQKAKTDGNDATRAVIYEYLAAVYEHTNNFTKAYHYIKKFYERKLDLLEKGFSDENNLLQAKIGLEDARRERLVAEETSNAKSLFIATISHEIRTPMNIILGTSALLLNDKPKDTHVKYLQTLKKSGENLLALINDILDISKIEAGKLEVEYEPVLIQNIFENLEIILLASATDKGLKLQFKADPKFDFHFYSDPLRLSQIITNLVSNAIKFTSEGSIKVSIKKLKDNRLQITVADTGMGIPKDKLKSIFEQYEQVRSKVQKKYKGTGLGLAITKKLVELMNGTISVKSTVNKGTSFIVNLPYVVAEIVENKTLISLDKEASFLNDKIILIVDDVEDNRFVVSETLKFFNKNIQIIEAENGKQGVERTKQFQPHLIIMDLDMPIMNGFEALTKIRKLKNKITPIIIASTASLITNSEDEFIEFGFNGYLPKPFDIDYFFALLAEQIG